MDDFDAVAGRSGGMLQFSVRELVFDTLVGVYEHERRTPQRVRLSIDFAVNDPAFDVAAAAGYARQTALERHATLVETLAERVAARCLDDGRVVAVRVRVDKLDIFPDAVVGVEIIRCR